MFTGKYKIDHNSHITDIVKEDYRTADVFKKYGIDFCCGGRQSLEMACMIRDIDVVELVRELQTTIRNLQLPASLPFHLWQMDFLADYIVNIHHYYVKASLPLVKEYAQRFADSHRKKFPESAEIAEIVDDLQKELLPHILHEEDIIFPYIKEITKACRNKEPYPNILVRTLQKPMEEEMHHAQEITGKMLYRLRQLTHQYQLPENACVTHRVTWSKLKEMDNDLVQHLHLENNILFPKVIEMEKELLNTA